jgi:hypothetical protein
MALETVDGLTMLGMVELNGGLLLHHLVDNDLAGRVGSDGHGAGKSHKGDDRNQNYGQLPVHLFTS